MTNKHVAIALLVSFLAGMTGGFVIGKGNVMAERAKAFAEGQQKVKSEVSAKFAAEGFGASVDEPVHSVYGFVKEVGAGEIAIEYDSAQFSFVESGKVTKNVAISTSTSLQKMIALPTPAPPPGTTAEGHPTGGPGSSGGLVSVRMSPNDPELKTSPSVTFEQKMNVITLSDLKPGDYVQVVSSNDIRTAEKIEAVAMVAYDKNAIPPDAGNDPSKLPFARGGGSMEGKPFVPTN